MVILLNENYHVCTGCALLCDDIEVVTDGKKITEVKLHAEKASRA